MTIGRRERLRHVQSCPESTHAGLWFERYFTDHQEDQSKRDLMHETARLTVPAIYREYFKMWSDNLPQNCCRAYAEVTGRIVIGTGEKGVADAGITLHQTYGVPYIPGSALKGLTATYANLRVNGFAEPTSRRIGPGPVAPYHTMFGAEDSAGYVTFFDALYIPGSAVEDCPLVPDVITGHHSKYYVGNTPEAPADWDSPVPVPFLTAIGRYLIALDGPKDWCDTALQILEMALRDNGIGAKTAAGYGRMRLLTVNGTPWPIPQAAPASTVTQTNNQPIAVPSMFSQQVAKSNAGSLPNLINQLDTFTPELQIAAAQLMVDRAQALQIRKLEEKPWYQQLLALLQPNM